MRRNGLGLAALIACSVHVSVAHAQLEPSEDGPDQSQPQTADGHDHGAEIERRAPQSGAAETNLLPSGSIAIAILDANNKPLAGVPVTLGIVESSIAKGEARKHEMAVSAADGLVRWDKQAVGSGFAYRISVVKDGATFAVTPFQLGPEKGVGGRLYVFPVVSSIDQATILTQAVTFFEIKDDRVQVEQAVTIANFGKNAWVPTDLTLDVPHDFRAFSTDAGMSDIAIDKLDGKDQLRIRGTFGPGQHEIVYRWQLPYSGQRELSVEVQAPPHMAAARTYAAAAQKMRLEVDGMGQGTMDDSRGQRVLKLEWEQANAKSAMKELRIHLRDIPEAGLPSWLMRSGVGLASLVALSAIVVVRNGKKRSDARARKDQRAVLLDELADLERVHATGDIGPKTYERARRELIDQIALTLEPARA